MIKKLRRRIILINMLLIGVLLAGIFIAVNVNNYSNAVSTMERGMTQVLEKEMGGPPEKRFFFEEGNAFGQPQEDTSAATEPTGTAESSVSQLPQASGAAALTVSDMRDSQKGDPGGERPGNAPANEPQKKDDKAPKQDATAPQGNEPKQDATRATAPQESRPPAENNNQQQQQNDKTERGDGYSGENQTSATQNGSSAAVTESATAPADNGDTRRDDGQKGLRRDFGDETPIEISSYVIVEVTKSGTINSKRENDLSIDADTLKACVAAALKSDKSFGQIDEYGVMFAKRGEMEQIKIVLASNSSIYTSLTRSALISVLLFIGAMAVIFFISLFLSGLAVKPVKKAWEQQKQFVADASHELKTPLTVILANNNIMLSHPDSTVEQERQWLESTEEEAGHMKKLIDNMLFLAKSDAGTAKVQFSEVDLSEIVEGCALNFEPVAFEKGILIDTEITPDITLQGDATQLNQLAHILTDNAVKYGAPDSTVTIKLARHNDKIEFSVNNRGNVIPPEEIEHIFDRFYRAEKSRTTKGYGLGLSIAQRITDSMNGKISVESTEEAGTTFTVRL